MFQTVKYLFKPELIATLWITGTKCRLGEEYVQKVANPIHFICSNDPSKTELPTY